MTEYHYLIGADDVKRAAETISDAADTLRSAASNLDHTTSAFSRTVEDLVAALDRHNEHMARLTAALEKHAR